MKKSFSDGIKYNSMVLEDKDILQADATVIAGILILLTIMHIKPSKQLETRREKITLLAQSAAIIVAILPFSLSAIELTILNMDLSLDAKQLTGFGFVYLFIAIAIFVVSPRLSVKEKTMQHG